MPAASRKEPDHRTAPEADHTHPEHREADRIRPERPEADRIHPERPEAVLRQEVHPNLVHHRIHLGSCASSLPSLVETTT